MVTSRFPSCAPLFVVDSLWGNAKSSTETILLAAAAPSAGAARRVSAPPVHGEQSPIRGGALLLGAAVWRMEEFEEGGEQLESHGL